MSSNTDIKIANGALQFLHQILNRTPFRDKAHANRLRKVFACIEKPMNAYMDALDELRQKYWADDIKKDAQGNETKSKVIPVDNRKPYEDGLLTLAAEQAIVTFDPPSLMEVKHAYNNLFEQKDIQENGMAGETQAKMIAEIGRALGEDMEADENVEDGQDQEEEIK